MTRSAANAGRRAIDEKTRILERGEGKCILAASQAYQKAFETVQKENSLFTHYLLEGLSGQAIDNNGNVTPDSLGKYAYEKIVSLPPEQMPRQRPIRKGEQSGEIILVSYPHLARRKTVMQGAFVSSSEIDKNDFLSCELPSYGIKISYPSNWMKFEKWQGLKGDLIVYFSSLKENANDPYSEGVGIGIKKLSSLIPTLEQFIQLNIHSLKINNPDFVLIDSSPIILAGRPAHRVVYSKKEKIAMHNIIIYQNLQYDVLYQAHPSGYFQNLPIVQKMLDSFEISH